ncbi:MAG: MgtC/SapB family protein [Solobacterium sp.]|nr:MgtC/SapB family protein [Solobacterium sp.]
MPQIHSIELTAVVLRLLTAAAAGGIIGYGRSKRNRAAGLRTYMLISMASALTMLMGSYDYEMLMTGWSDAVAAVGMKYDGARYASSVISGIGFLAAGTIIASEHQRIDGLTTAIGLFASTTMGLAAGAGLYPLVALILAALYFGIDTLYPVEKRFKRAARNFTVYVEFNAIEDLSTVTEHFRERNATVFEVDIEHSKHSGDTWPGAVIAVRLPQENASHTDMMTSIAELPCVRLVKELMF